MIEHKVLDDSDVVNRILMCLYINDKYFGSLPPMTTGDISKLLKQLGVPVSTANVSSAILRKASSYVMYDGVWTKGAVIRYSINRRGLQYFEGFLNGSEKSVSQPSRKASVTSKKITDSKKKAAQDTKAPTEALAKSKAKLKKADSGYKPKFNNQLDLLGLEDFLSSMIRKKQYRIFGSILQVSKRESRSRSH